MHYYQHHIGDFIKATSRLSDSQAMAYLRLIWIYYDRNGVVENDPKQLAFEIGSDSETVQLIIKTYFEIDGKYIKQSRCDKELQGYLAKSEGGKIGANNRWKNRVSNSLPIANPMPPQCDPNANQEPITNNHIIKTTKVVCPTDVNEQVWNDWLQLRKAKKASVTKTVVDGARKEAQKAQLSLEDFLKIWCLRGSQGLEASWLKPEEKQKYKTQAEKTKEVLSGLTRGLIGGSNDVKLL